MSKSTQETTATASVAVMDLPELSEGFANLTGEDVRIPRLVVPQISVSYKDEDDALKGEGEVKGEFVEYEPETKTRKGLGKSITIQILHHRQSLNGYTETEQWFTPEGSMKQREFSLFSVTTSPAGKRTIRFVTKGEQRALREQFKDLGYRRILYVIHEGKLKSVVVKGASFSKFIDLTKALKGASSSSVLLDLTTEKGKKGTVTYYSIVFTPNEKIDETSTLPILQRLSEWFAKYDSLIAEQQKDRANQASIERGDETANVSVSVTASPSTPESIADELGLDDEKEEPKPTEQDLKNAGI